MTKAAAASSPLTPVGSGASTWAAHGNRQPSTTAMVTALAKGRRRHPARRARLVSLGLSTTAAVGLIGSMHPAAATAASAAARKKAVSTAAADAVARAADTPSADTIPVLAAAASDAVPTNLPPPIAVPTTLAAVP